MYVSRNINLAQRAIDGSKIYIPALGENAPNNSISQGNNNPVQEGNEKLININTASEIELDSLPGVGAVPQAKSFPEDHIKGLRI